MPKGNSWQSQSYQQPSKKGTWKSSKGRQKGSNPQTSAIQATNSKLDKLINVLAHPPKPAPKKKSKPRNQPMSADCLQTWRPFGNSSGRAPSEPFDHRVEKIAAQATFTITVAALTDLGFVFTPSTACGNCAGFSSFSAPWPLSDLQFERCRLFAQNAVTAVEGEEGKNPFPSSINSPLGIYDAYELEPRPDILVAPVARVLRGAFRIRAAMSPDVMLTLCWAHLTEADFGVYGPTLVQRHKADPRRFRKQLRNGQWHTISGLVRDPNKMKLFHSLETHHISPTNTFYTTLIWFEGVAAPSNGFAALPIITVETLQEVDTRLDPSWRHIATHTKGGGDKDTQKKQSNNRRKSGGGPR